MQVHGLIDGFPLQALRSLARASYTGASTIVTLGPAMAERLRAYTGGSTRLAWAPLWVPPELVPWPTTQTVPLRGERGWADERLVLMYSGNLGLGHRFGEFLEAATRLGPEGPRWAFAGTGRSRPIVERFVVEHPELPVELLPYAPEARLREHLCSADVHLISMDSRWEGTLLPSKLQASFAVGRPVIFVGGESQDMARWILESGGGWVVAEDDGSGLLRAVAEAGDAAERARRGRLALAFAEARFHRERGLDALVSLFTS
jgi:glycosyltransferase involved in cell wall biosynthesis